MGSEDFFKILITEMQQQDPFEPTDTSDMIGQISDISTIETSKHLTDVLNKLTQQQHSAGTSELLGRFVIASLEDAEGTQYEIGGVVTGVQFEPDGSALLELDTGELIPAAKVTNVMSAERAEELMAAAQATQSGDGAATDKSGQTAKENAEKSPWEALLGMFFGS